MLPDEYDDTHWEDLINTIIGRIGIERFLEMAAHVLEQRTQNIAAIKILAGKLVRGKRMS